MKVIDLLNDMAKGKNNEDNLYQFSLTDYCTIREFFDRYIVDEENLNLEIIEDTPKEDKKIEKLKMKMLFVDDPSETLGKKIIYRYNTEELGNKLNEIIDRLNGE